MFSNNVTKSTIICGPLEITKALIFEAAIHWAEEGHRVVYITPTQIQSLPATYHDRHNLSPAAFKLMRFMYLPSYEILVEQLVTLDTFAVLPSVLLIDDLDTYVRTSPTNEQDVNIAKLCAIIFDSTNACSRILKNPVHLCAATSTRDIIKTPYTIYFDATWHLRIVSADDSGQNIELFQGQEDDYEVDKRKIFNYRNLTDRTLILKQISERFISYK